MRHMKIWFSRLRSAGYSMETRIMEIAFKDGTLMKFRDVPSTIYFSLLNAYSPDNYFERYIRDIFNAVCINRKKDDMGLS